MVLVFAFLCVVVGLCAQSSIVNVSSSSSIKCNVVAFLKNMLPDHGEKVPRGCLVSGSHGLV